MKLGASRLEAGVVGMSFRGVVGAGCQSLTVQVSVGAESIYTRQFGVVGP